MQMWLCSWGLEGRVQDKDSPIPILSLSGGQRCNRRPKFCHTSGCRTGRSMKQPKWKASLFHWGSCERLLVHFVHWLTPTTEGLLCVRCCAQSLGTQMTKDRLCLEGLKHQRNKKTTTAPGSVVLTVSTGHSETTEEGISPSLRGSPEASGGRE